MYIMGQQSSSGYVDKMMQPPISNNGAVTEFFLNNASPIKSSLASEQHLLKPVYTLQKSTTINSRDSWRRPEIRGLSGKLAEVGKRDPLAKSIDKVCQGPLYKENYYNSVNMSVCQQETTEEKNAKPKISTLPPFKDVESNGAVPKGPDSRIVDESIKETPKREICVGHSPRIEKSRLVRRTAVCLRCKHDKMTKRTSPVGFESQIVDVSPLNGSANIYSLSESNFVTPPNSQITVSIPKTSTPKKSEHFHNQVKSVHFSSSVKSKLSPLPFDLLESDYTSSSNRPQPVGRDSIEQCHEEFITNLMEKKRQSELLEKVNLKTPEKCKLSRDVSITETSSPPKSTDVQKELEKSKTPIASQNSMIDDYSLPDDSLLRQYLTMQMDTSMQYEGCVQQWIQDIRTLVEAECLNVLQAKTLTKDPGMLSAIAVRNAQDTIKALQRRTENLLEDFDYVLESLSIRRWSEFCTDCLSLLQSIKYILNDYSTTHEEKFAQMTKNEICLKRACEDLEEFLKRNSDKSQSDERKTTVKRNILSVLRTLKELVDQFTVQQLSLIVELAEEGTSVYCLQMALTALTVMGQSGEAMCELIAKAGGPRVLLSICIENKWRPLRAAALRVLTIVCSVPGAIRQLEQAGGIECITDVLCEQNLEESVRSEAAGLLAQITAPWMDSEGITLRGLVENLDKLVCALTDLARNTKSSEVLLLAAAALANLSFLDKRACELLKKHGSAQVLISACRHKTLTESVFIKDQVATVLANMAAVPNCKSSVLEAGALVSLLCFLQMHPSTEFNEAELSACERVQQKSAIALSRLCTDKKTCAAVVAMQGVKRLIRLCKDSKERNNSDSVLVAALASLRKIASICGIQEFKAMKAEELVEPTKLWDSFLIYCSKQESFV